VLKLETAPTIEVEEESYSDSSDSDSDESEKSFEPPTQGTKVENEEPTVLKSSSLTSGVKITPAKKPLEFAKPQKGREEKKPYKPVNIPVRKEHLKDTQRREERPKEIYQREERPKEIHQREERPREVYPIPESEGFRWMYFEDIPTTKEDFKYKSKRWPGFRNALKKIGLHPNEIEMRILKGNKTWKDEETHKKICQKSRARFLIQQHEASKITSQRDERITTDQWIKRSRSRRRRRKKSLAPPPESKTAAWEETERQLVNG
jgi:hypothetical protein